MRSDSLKQHKYKLFDSSCAFLPSFTQKPLLFKRDICKFMTEISTLQRCCIVVCFQCVTISVPKHRFGGGVAPTSPT